MPTILFPCEVPLWANVSRACAANVNAPRPDHRPPSREPLLPAWMFLPLTPAELGATLREDRP